MMLQELAPCACGTTRYGCGGRCCGAAGSPFSLLFPVAGGQLGYYGEEGPSQYGGGVPVDCTLSLGTPSTRRAEAGAQARGGGGGRQDDGGAGASCKESGRQPTARRCANCDTTSTPLWRNGPRGPKSLCNACGIRYKKEERRAAAATQDTGLGPYAREHQQQPQWGCYGSGGAKLASFATYGDSTAADGPCLSWMLNVKPSSPAFAVRERPTPTLFQYC